jgi:hypothetical protein|tara:strand:+ start:1190 stop:1408 length:219 start_codon:yes stop_codon:yes gene_type:complete
MIKIVSDHKPSLRLYINNEIMLDDTIEWRKFRIEPTINTEATLIQIKNTGSRSFTANKITITPNQMVDITNK